MEQIPTLEVRVRDFGQQVNGLLTLHEREIAEYLTTGVERAVAGIGPKLIDEACTLAIQKIHEDVKHYLLYGEGGKALRAAVHQALAPLTAMLCAAGREAGADDLGVAESPDASPVVVGPWGHHRRLQHALRAQWPHPPVGRGVSQVCAPCGWTVVTEAVGAPGVENRRDQADTSWRSGPAAAGE